MAQPQKKTIGVSAGPQRASALTSVIYPALGKLLQANQDDEAVITCLAQLKVAFDNAEKVKPGISHTFVALMIDTLRGQQQRK